MMDGYLFTLCSCCQCFSHNRGGMLLGSGERVKSEPTSIVMIESNCI